MGVSKVAKLRLCVILNGPPLSGKDTLADMLTDFGFSKHEMKGGLYLETANHFNFNLDFFKEIATDRNLKETPFSALGGRTPRQALIYVSEEIIKPMYGNSYFGEMAAKSCIKEGTERAVFSDGGFSSEIAPLAEVFETVMIFHLYKNGTSFKGDSRSYLEGFSNTYPLTVVDGFPELAVAQILAAIERLDQDKPSKI